MHDSRDITGFGLEGQNVWGSQARDVFIRLVGGGNERRRGRLS
jgi:hypothetical protein